MNRLFCFLSSSFALLLTATSIQAQIPPEVRTFQEAAGDRSVLYRGKQANRATFPANGHLYWETPEYVVGEIVFDDKCYGDVSLNIDAYAQCALARLSRGQVSVALPAERVSSLTFDGRRFVTVTSDPAGVLPDGFFEVLGTGPEQVYKHVVKHLSSSTVNVNGKAIGYYDENYNTNLTRYFSISTSYYFRDRDGHFTRFRTKGQLLRKFPDRRREIRRSLRAQGIDSFDVGFDAYCLAILNEAAR